MRHLVRELDGALLDAAVAKAEGFAWRLDVLDEETSVVYARRWKDLQPEEAFCPSMYWDHGGPILGRERISLTSPDARERIGGQWGAEVMGTLLERDRGGNDYAFATAATPLIAAMRAYVASKFGEEVELP